MCAGLKCTLVPNSVEIPTYKYPNRLLLRLVLKEIRMLGGRFRPHKTPSHGTCSATTKLMRQEFPGLDHVVGHAPDEREVSLEPASLL